jgi:hypothetical protein
MSTSIAADAGLFEMLNGIANVDIPRNLQAAISAGRRMTSILREVVSLRRGAGKLTRTSMCYAEVGIRNIMWTNGLCRAVSAHRGFRAE